MTMQAPSLLMKLEEDVSLLLKLEDDVLLLSELDEIVLLLSELDEDLSLETEESFAAVESFAVVESFATVELLEELLLAALPDSVPMLEESAMSISEELPGVVMAAELESLSLQAKKVVNVVAMNVVYTSLFRFIEILL